MARLVTAWASMQSQTKQWQMASLLAFRYLCKKQSAAPTEAVALLPALTHDRAFTGAARRQHGQRRLRMERPPGWVSPSARAQRVHRRSNPRWNR
jgi:hypothetical protein